MIEMPVGDQDQIDLSDLLQVFLARLVGWIGDPGVDEQILAFGGLQLECGMTVLG